MEGEQNGTEAAAPVAPVQTSSLSKKVPSLIGWALAVFAFLVPIFAIPNVATSLDASKAWLLLTAVFVGGIAVLLQLLLRSEVSLPKSLAFFALEGVVVATLLSALMSPQTTISLIGNGSQVGTFSTILLVALLTFLGVQAFRDRAPLFRFFMALFAGFSALSIFHVLRLIVGANLFSFGVFQSPVFSLIGKWNDFAVFSGLILLLSVIAEFYFRQSPKVLWASRVFGLLSIIFLVMIDFWILWIVIAVLAAIFAVRTMFHNTDVGGVAKNVVSFTKVSYMALVVVLFGACFGFLFRFPMGDSASTISQSIVSKLSPQPYAEIVLPPNLTNDITAATWGEGAKTLLFGSGANRFSNSYFMHKPEGINSTPLWDSSFESGFSHVTTFFATTGVVGTIAWIFLLVTVLGLFVRVIRDKNEGVKGYLGQSTAFGTLYLFIILVCYLPNLALVSLAFLFLGALIAFLVSEGSVKSMNLTLPSTKGWGVAMVPVIVFCAIGLSVFTYMVSGSIRAETSYQNARVLANQGNAREAIAATERAISLAERDSQYRLKTDLHLLELQRVLGEAPSSPEAFQEKVRELAVNASSSANMAIAWDPTNYLNYVSKASIWDVFATLNIDRQTTAAIARDSYIDATRQNPFSPRLEFAIGRAELLLDNREGAKLHLGKARDLRPAYPEAIAALAELNRQDGNMGKAIEIATAGLQSDPSNFIISFQLGFLYYSNQDYDKAIAAFENALAVNPFYADAKYFLGISYARKGNKDAAMKQFEEVKSLNADNAEIVRVMKNLSEGRDPLADQ